MAKDLVCGMQVDPEKAAAMIEYKGQTYCFCAVGHADVETRPAAFECLSDAGQRRRTWETKESCRLGVKRRTLS